MNKPFQVALLSNYPPDRQESMQRFARLLCQGLAQAGCSVEILRPAVRMGAVFSGRSGLGKLAGYIDKYLLFPPQLRRHLLASSRSSARRLLVHICDHSNAVYVPQVSLHPHLVTCNDLLAVRSAFGEIPEHSTRPTGRLLQRWILASLRRFPWIACISQATAEDVLRLVGLPSHRVRRIWMGLNHPYRPMPALQAREALRNRFSLSPDPFILHVGTNDWYKNRPGVLRIFARLLQLDPAPCQLVMVGPPTTLEMRRFIEDHQMQSRLCILENCSNEDLQALYSAAQCLLFPSLYEGFGWPIIEAQACGCPVVTSQRPPMNEIGGPAVCYVDPANPCQAADRLRSVLDESWEKRLKRQRLGWSHARQFAPEAMVQEYLQLYQEVLGQWSLAGGCSQGIQSGALSQP